MPHDPGLEALEQLGLTPLEARAYVVLLREGPSTAYRVAQKIDRPPPNVYRLIESLVEKGLVEVQDGKKKLYRGVPYEQMLDLLERRFKSSREAATEALSALRAGSGRGARLPARVAGSSHGALADRCWNERSAW